MPKQEKGILGVKKDPKNQILFSFKVRDGEEWPSDDDDSDYNPYESSEDETKGKGGGKRKNKDKQKGKKSAKRKKVDTSKKAVDSKPRETRKAVDIGDLPPLPVEIWEKIFEYVIAEEGAVPFLLKIAPYVCELWSDLSKKMRLWKKADLSFGWFKMADKTFQRFCRTRLKECQHLNLSGSKLTKNLDNIQAISDNCPQLAHINLARCDKLPNDTINTILKGCKLLRDIDLSGTTADSVSPQTLSNIASTCSTHLTKLVLTNNPVKAFGVSFSSLLENCPNLEHLDISHITLTSTFSIDIEKFQRSCPNLKVLGLANSSFRATLVTQRAWELSPGFPNLEELSVAVTIDDFASAITEHVLHRFLKNATKLRVLDMRGCKNVGAISCIEEIHAENLEQLYLSRSAVISCDNLPQIMNKWRHSLVDLDLSWNNFKSDILQNTVSSLCSQQSPCIIQQMSMVGTSISMDMVRKLLKSLPNLESLDLTSCRDVSRGCKREYKSKKELEALRQAVK